MRRLLVAGFVVLLVVSIVPGLAAADTRVGGTVTVAADETTDDVSATGGTIVVEGTVDGDLRAYGSTIRIAEGGEVTGIVRAYGSDVRIDGTVGGNALAYGGSVTLGESGSVDGSFGAVAGSVEIAGAVGSDANVVAGSTVLTETATIDRNLNYAGALEDRGATVDGAVQSTEDLALVPPLAPFVFAAGGLLFVGNLLLGAILLRLFPEFADAATETVVTEPLHTGGAGLAGLVALGVAVPLFAITIVGLPIAVALLAVGAVGAWVAAIYGRYVVGAIVLSYTDVENRYLALLVGVVGVGLLGLVPFLGIAIRAIVLLLGAGVLVFGALAARELIDRGGGLTSI
ncbi:MAG: polymer-forming cytoskeletal protein [Natronomonas sp.]